MKRNGIPSPISSPNRSRRAELFAGKFLGLALGLLATLALGFGSAGILLATQGAGDPTAYLILVGLAFLLALVMLSVGMLVSAWTRRANVAVAICLFLWLVFVLLGDLGMMGAAVAFRMPAEGLLWTTLANPLQVFKLAAIANIQSSLELLGPAGIYAMRTFGDGLSALLAGLLAVWIVLPALLAYLRLAQRNDL